MTREGLNNSLRVISSSTTPSWTNKVRRSKIRTESSNLRPYVNYRAKYKRRWLINRRPDRWHLPMLSVTGSNSHRISGTRRETYIVKNRYHPPCGRRGFWTRFTSVTPYVRANRSVSIATCTSSLGDRDIYSAWQRLIFLGSYLATRKEMLSSRTLTRGVRALVRAGLNASLNLFENIYKIHFHSLEALPTGLELDSRSQEVTNSSRRIRPRSVYSRLRLRSSGMRASSVIEIRNTPSLHQK